MHLPSSPFVLHIPHIPHILRCLITRIIFDGEKVKVKYSLQQAYVAQRVSRGIALLFLNLGTRRRWCGRHNAPAALPPGKDPVPIVQEAGWAPGPVWTCAKNLAPTGIFFLTFNSITYIFYLLHYRLHQVTYSVASLFNLLKTERRLLYLKALSVPRCKHFSSLL
jgi:hypothetical protein